MYSQILSLKSKKIPVIQSESDYLKTLIKNDKTRVLCQVKNNYQKRHKGEKHLLRKTNQYLKSEIGLEFFYQYLNEDKNYQKHNSIDYIYSIEFTQIYEKYRSNLEEKKKAIEVYNLELNSKQKKCKIELKKMQSFMQMVLKDCKTLLNSSSNRKWIIKQIYSQTEDFYTIGKIYFEDEELSQNNIEEYIETFKSGYDSFYIETEELEQLLYDEVLVFLKQKNPFVEICIQLEENFCDDLYELINDFIMDSDIFSSILEMITEETVLHFIEKNSNYKKVIQDYKEKLKEKEHLRTLIYQNTPVNYVDFFPQTRKMKRHFILHIGPTNSGRTYDALKEFTSDKKCAYYAPLRLMAFETYESLNKRKILCTLKTGEEVIETKSAKAFSKTIELFSEDELEKFDLAIIDEAQMLSDKQRGWAWTNVILGILASEIHICSAPEAEKVLKQLIVLCHDTFEVIYHERKTELISDTEPFNFPENIKKGDAFIVFSRRNVLACAALLQKMNYQCSLIYGSLPYEAKQKEVERFSSGKTDIIIATDAIGMEMNLPIQRIVFLETKKYDGESFRLLTNTEIKQIAGRAGRFGQYNTGYFTAEKKDFSFLIKAMTQKIFDIQSVYISFPQSLLNLDEKVSVLIKEWSNVSFEDKYKLFKKADFNEKIQKCEILEKYSSDKSLIYQFSNIPFSLLKERLLFIWKEIFFHFTQKNISNPVQKFLESNFFLIETKNDLSVLEQNYEILDLLYHCAKVCNEKESLFAISEKKQELSNKIEKILVQKMLKEKECKICHTILPWNSPYQLCEKCYRRKIYYS